MSTQKAEQQMVVCYLCQNEDSLDATIEIPLSTGGNVRVHPSCFDFYVKQQQQASACSSCSSGSCDSCDVAH